MSLFRYSLLATFIGSAPSSTAIADEFVEPTLSPSQTDFGGVGLMQMPSGRMAKEGEFNFGGSFNNEYFHGSVSLQLLPWFETTIRYTTVQDLLYNSDHEYSGDTKYTDKGIDFKVRLIEESYWLPETSVGVRDFGGTGLFDGEFVAATKRFGNLDVTLGMGWGYIGQSGNVTNPFCKASDKYCSRGGDFKGSGGSVDFERWFKGPAAIYGGIEYQTPYEPLRIKVEYDANDYSQDFPVQNTDVDMTQHTPWNFGVLYRLGDWGDMKVSYQRGDTLTLGVNLMTNFNEMKATWRDESQPEYKPNPISLNSKDNDSAHTAQWQEVATQLKVNAGYKDAEIFLSPSVITISGEQIKYRDRDEGYGRAATILANHTTSDITQFVIIETKNGLPITKTTVDASHYRAIANHEYLGADVSDAANYASVSESILDVQKPVASEYKAFSYGLSPTLSQSLGGPEGFYLYSFGITGESSYKLTSNLELSGSLYLNLIDNYDSYNYVEESPHIRNFSTPRVRTLFRAYVHDNPLRMNHLQLTWFEQLSSDLYMQNYGGYLESMFAGVGSEVLYRPYSQNWAIGADINLISQRDPDSWFGTYDEEYFVYDGGCPDGELKPDCAARVLDKGYTGFITGYYMPQWSVLRNTLLKVSVGQFLGQDKGTRIDFSKQFDSGVIAGAYASFTDLSAEEFGEGSYTKGFYISIPFDIMTVKPSANRAQINWQPLTRDGGQTLKRQYELFDVTDGKSPWFTRKGL